MSEVKRYTQDWRNQEMEEYSLGDYVKFEDYEKLKAQLERAEKVIQHYVDLFGDRYGGKEAREYFKENNKGERNE